jgi:general secretion pathway protein G
MAQDVKGRVWKGRGLKGPGLKGCGFSRAVKGARNRGFSPGAAAGFTLLELMVVIIILMIIMGIAVPMYNQSILHTREKTLRADLDTLNKLIVEYTRDKQKAPQSLDDLVTAKYLQQIPKDPITRETNWEVEQGEVLLTVDQQDPGITGVHSASNAIGSNGVAYSQW